MPKMELLIQTIGVVGAGQMGCGIAQVFASSGFQVLLYDTRPVSPPPVPMAKTMEELANVDLLVEAIKEDEATKLRLFKELDNLLKKSTIFASNTSSLSITTLAEATQRAERFIGLHFMNPAEKMPLVEVVRGAHTNQETVEAILEVVTATKKVPVRTEDRPGFVVNRLLIPMINDAIWVLSEKIATREDIDKAMHLGAHHPLGPLALADLIGLDTCLSIMQILQKGLPEHRYKPCPLLEETVAQGHLGKKSGKGFYDYG